MSTYPISPRADFVEWCQAHASVFLADPDAIGMTSGQAAKFASMTDAAAKAILAQQAAQQAARVATQQARDALANLQAGAGDAVRSIRAYAELRNDPNAIYNAARIAPPADPSPSPAPDKPRQLAVTLVAATGALTLTWKAANPRGLGGTSYIVRRRLPGETAFTFLGVTGEKQFSDETVPAGVRRVEYTIQGQRGKRTGPLSEILLVVIGKEERPREAAVMNASATRKGIAMPTGDAPQRLARV